MSQRTPMAPPPPPSINGERPKKRVRLSEHVEPTIMTRQMDDVDTSLEVDHMILDYMVYQAINTCFACQNMPRLENGLSPVERSLVQVDEFVHLFQHRYPRYRPDPELRFRHQLLQVVTLVTQRHVQTSTTPPKTSLQTLRAQSQARAREWIGDASRLPTAEYDTTPFDNELPLPPRKLDDNRARALEEVNGPAEDHDYEDAFFGTSASVSLLDILPLFMRVSASCRLLFDDNDLSSQWMRLAAEWMRQACLEQYLIYAKDGSDAIDEAFAWGYKISDHADARRDANPDSPFDLGFVSEDVERWQIIRRRALTSLFPNKNQNGELDSGLVWHLGAVALTNPVVKMQEDVLRFFQSLADATTKPVLAQLETGQLDGMTKDQTQDFLKDCGLNISKFVGHGAALDQMDET